VPNGVIADWLHDGRTNGWLADGATVVVERPARAGRFAWPEPIEPGRYRRYGDTVLHWGHCPPGVGR
jgi:16S rRNA (guanine966-N2)-methyltransferase